MNWLRELARSIRALFCRSRFEDDLTEEMRFHLAHQIEENLAAGMNPEKAGTAALREFGGVEQLKEECRDAWGTRTMDTLLKDIRFGLRQLRRNPGFTIVAIVTLALGIGANTAIFTLVDATMLRTLPVANPHELYQLGHSGNCCVIGGFQDNWDIYSYPLYQQLRDHTPEFSQMAAFAGGLAQLSVRRKGATGLAEPFVGEGVSGNYFSMFGVTASVGRLISPQDDEPNAPPVAVMSYRAWQQHFGLDPSIIGSTVFINTVPYTVAGIAPQGYFGDRLSSEPPDFWLPLSTEPELDGKSSSLLGHADQHWLYAIGRLRPGANPASVQSELTAELQHWLGEQPKLSAHDRSELGKQHIDLASAARGVRDVWVGGPGAGLLMILSSLVLLIACANIANLLLARGAARRTETAIRTALGAPRLRLIRQTLTESLLLAVLGGTAGIYIAYIGARTILAIAFRGSTYIPISASPSWTVLSFAFVLSLITGIVFGVAPAWIGSRCHPAEALHGAGRTSRDHSSLPRKSLVVLQVALSLALLTGAGLLTQSLQNLENQSFGFEPEGRWVVRVDPGLAGYTVERLGGLYQQLEQRLTQIPGVESAAWSLYTPMQGENWADDIRVEGRQLNEAHPDNASFDRVSPHYFETVGTRLIRGRTFNDADTPTSLQAAVINQTFAKQYFAGQDPIGKHFGFNKPDEFEIVGVVEDAKYQDARAPAYPTFFLPFLQTSKDPKLFWLERSQFMGDIELRVAGRADNLNSEVRRTLAGIDPNLCVLGMMSLNEQVAENFNGDRLIARLTELFSALALILACVGLYGVTSYAVARRTNEIGIRMAIGASRGSVLSLILRGAFAQVVVGLAIGIPIALAGGRLMANLLYGVKGWDPLTLGSAVMALALCALVAALVPARRAMKVDPMVALRYE
jgi:predicted permease